MEYWHGGCGVGDAEIGIVVGMRQLEQEGLEDRRDGLVEDVEVKDIGMRNAGLMDIRVWETGQRVAS